MRTNRKVWTATGVGILILGGVVIWFKGNGD